MSWLFSQALVAAYWPATSSAGAPSAPLSVMPTPHKFSRHGKLMDVSRLSQFGQTCEALTDIHGAALLTSYLAAFPAKTYQLQAKAKALQARVAACGASSPASSGKCNPNPSLSKTAPCCALADLTKSSLILPASGSMQGGKIYPHPKWEPSISATDSGSLPPVSIWATPTCMDTLPPKGQASLMREATVTRPNRSKPANLRDQVSSSHLWPTPVASNAKQGRREPDGKRGIDLVTAVRINQPMWPTITVSGNNNRAGLSNKSGDGLATAVKRYPTPCSKDATNWNTKTIEQRKATGSSVSLYNAALDSHGNPAGGQLNPNWVEWLMGWPIGWTELNPLAMDKFHAWQQQHGGH